VAQYFTQVNSYHVILEILPELQGDTKSLDNIYIKSPTTGDQVPLSAFTRWTTVPVRPLSISHQGQFPATTISFNLAQELRLDKPPTPFRLRSRNSACRPLSMAASRARRRLSSNHSAPCRC
jgi:multidrug efflux pump subunit AcrB